MGVNIRVLVKIWQGMSIMVLSKDETTNKVVVCAGVPDKSDQLDAIEWLTIAMAPINGKCRKEKGKHGRVSGQV